MSSNEIQNNKLQLLGKLTASVVHEIRNPLSAIKLNLDYLRMMSEKLTPEVKESIDDSTEAVLRIHHLVEDILNFSKKKTEDIKLVSLNDVTENALNIMHGEFIKNSVECTIDLTPKLSEVYFEKNKLLQVFINLFTNAIEACNGNCKIAVRTYEEVVNENNVVYWTIQDNGTGIKSGHQTKIFEDFFTSKKKGTGLGLSVCKMLLTEFNANIKVVSELGKGSKFIISFNPNLPKEVYER